MGASPAARRLSLARPSPPWRREEALSRRLELVAAALAALSGRLGRAGLAGLSRRRPGRTERLPPSR
jgi:hypothetical protein